MAQRDGRGAHATGTGMHQSAFAPGQLRFAVQVEIGGGEHFRQRSGLGEGEPLRLRQHLAGRHHHGFGVAAAGQEGANRIARRHAADALAHFRHHASALQTENRAGARGRRIAAAALQQIGAVDGGGVVANPHFARAQRGFVRIAPDEPVVHGEDGFHGLSPFAFAASAHQRMRTFTPRWCRYCLRPETV